MSAPVGRTTAEAVEWMAGILVERDATIDALRAELAVARAVIRVLEVGNVAHRTALAACRSALADVLVDAPWRVTGVEIEAARVSLDRETQAANRAIRSTK